MPSTDDEGGVEHGEEHEENGRERQRQPRQQRQPREHAPPAGVVGAGRSRHCDDVYVCRVPVGDELGVDFRLLRERCRRRRGLH
ncbi:hypothetical protein PMKS-002830 [Pichia membranifaciens]|uniref:Uncharacterized protein n=1 Tax=Pichia membranifaciens TaxID=4926 RepID=A0A1Q2YIH3_9ASCO|nr:hypothetical protein PMKS-002830 [Pichia membranifaciens]